MTATETFRMECSIKEKAERIASLESQLSSLKQRNEELEKQRDRIIEIVFGDGSEHERVLLIKTALEEKRTWRFQSFTTEQAYRSGRFFHEQDFTDFNEMKVFSAKHGHEMKAFFPNYCSTYFDVQNHEGTTKQE